MKQKKRPHLAGLETCYTIRHCAAPPYYCRAPCNAMQGSKSSVQRRTCHGEQVLLAQLGALGEGHQRQPRRKVAAPLLCLVCAPVT